MPKLIAHTSNQRQIGIKGTLHESVPSCTKPTNSELYIHFPFVDLSNMVVECINAEDLTNCLLGAHNISNLHSNWWILHMSKCYAPLAMNQTSKILKKHENAERETHLGS